MEPPVALLPMEEEEVAAAMPWDPAVAVVEDITEVVPLLLLLPREEDMVDKLIMQ